MKNDFKNLKNILATLEKNFNNKLLELAKQLINNIFGGQNIIKTINKKINIKNIINKIKKISNILEKISDKAINLFIPILETINIFIENNTIDKIIDKVQKLMNKLNSLLNEKIIPIIDFINNENNELSKGNLNKFHLVNIKILIPKEIKESIDYFEDDLLNINENIENNIITKIEDIQNYILDLDDYIDSKIHEALNKLFDPLESIIKKLSEIPNKIKEKIESYIIDFITKELNNINKELNNFIKGLIDKTSGKLGNFISENSKICGKLLKGGEKFYKNASGILKGVISKPAELMDKFQSLCDGMNSYEQRSQEDQVINILNDTIINKLIDILMKALSNSKIGQIISSASQKLLKELQSTKKNLREELEEVAALPDKNYTSNLKNKFIDKLNSKIPNISKIKFDHILSIFIKIKST